MITVSEYAGRKAGVFGLGKAGEATVASLLAGGAEVYAWDDGEASRAKLAARYEGKLQIMPFEQWPWSELKTFVLSPGVPLTHPKPHASAELAHKHNCPVIGDIELLYRACPKARYVAITGTNGKSTTTTLIGHILKEAGIECEVGGNLGTPALDLKPLGAEGTYVLELSSYQLDLIKTTRFNVAVFLNVTPDHLDRHGSMEGYIAAKMHLFERQQPTDKAIIAVDDEYTWEIADSGKFGQGELITVSAHNLLERGVFVKDGILHDRLSGVGSLLGKITSLFSSPKERTYDLRSIVTLTGRHNWQNAACAYAAARACGIAPNAIYKAMQSFAGLRHRLQLVATIRGVRFINDSKATNADATSNALAPYDAIYWIAGGKPKAGGIKDLKPFFSKVAHAFLIGEAEEEFAETLEGQVAYTRSHTLKQAVEQAAQKAFTDGKHNAVVLLSPACASFDQWKNFEERGDAFCDMVNALAAAEKPAGGTRYAV